MPDPVHFVVVTPGGKLTVLNSAFLYAREEIGLKGQVTQVLTASGHFGDRLIVTAPSPDGVFTVVYLDDPTAPDNPLATAMAVRLRAPEDTTIKGNAVFLSDSDVAPLNDTEVALLRMLHSAIADTL
ncbi:hypothetical protein [Alloactinosynnema sp. L-07]|uniref:hypothetical protein n=1 Tax=Alloactinosynnema sp. L-07 TaxID=1653480 RepID=UPI00065EF924|nr:hypothetical protein [Alloactinosynnema sp. L-07]CRK57086.1 hypothetical protein [Alloactinosynnema sp. L-07]